MRSNHTRTNMSHIDVVPIGKTSNDNSTPGGNKARRSSTSTIEIEFHRKHDFVKTPGYTPERAQRDGNGRCWKLKDGEGASKDKAGQKKHPGWINQRHTTSALKHEKKCHGSIIESSRTFGASILDALMKRLISRLDKSTSRRVSVRNSLMRKMLKMQNVRLSRSFVLCGTQLLKMRQLSHLQFAWQETLK